MHKNNYKLIKQFHKQIVNNNKYNFNQLSLNNNIFINNNNQIYSNNYCNNKKLCRLYSSTLTTSSSFSNNNTISSTRPLMMEHQQQQEQQQNDLLLNIHNGNNNISNNIDPLHRLTITTFNILAPCYQTVAIAEQIPNRQDNILHTIDTLNSDILNLQEFYFNDSFKILYENQLSSRYNSIFLQRTSHKKDGIAIYIKKNYHVLNKKLCKFHDQGDRVALLLHIKSPIGAEFIIVNTHLTFPHNQFDEEILRLSQIQMVQENIINFTKNSNISELPVIVCGDFNSPYSPLNEDKCVVNKFLTKNQYFSTFNKLHPEMKQFVSHKNHLQQEVGVDFIYLRDNQLETLVNPKQPPSLDSLNQLKGTHLYPVDSYFYPRELNPDKWHKDINISDHRPLTTTFRIIYNPVN